MTLGAFDEASEQPIAPRRCLAILVGASEWISEAGYPPAPEFAAAAAGVREYISAPNGLSVPDNFFLDLFDSHDSADLQLRNIRRFLSHSIDNHMITDVLVYCISHGIGTRHDPRDLHLVVNDSEHGFIDGTGLPIRQLAAALHRSAPRLRRYVVLDCCFSGAALAYFQAGGEGVATLVAADIRREASSIADPAETLSQVAAGSGYGDISYNLPSTGTVLLCSSHADELSLAKASDGRTLFTSALLRVLMSRRKTEFNHGHTRLSFARLRDEIWGVISTEIGQKAPYPQLYAPRQINGDLSTASILPIIYHAKTDDASNDKSQHCNTICLASGRLIPYRHCNLREFATANNLDPEKDFISSDMRGINFGNSSLFGFNFTGADMRKANFLTCDIIGAVFKHANLSDALLSPAQERSLSRQLSGVNAYLIPRISVIGVGGAGGNVVTNMMAAQLSMVTTIAINTDGEALKNTATNYRLQIGLTTTHGKGANSHPEIGRAAAEESKKEISGFFKDADIVFITAGMGGGTGTGAAPVIARLAREAGILTVGIVTKPFRFEGRHRMATAESGIPELLQYVHALIVIPNQNIFSLADEKTTFADAFKIVDDVIYRGIRGIADLVAMPGIINLDIEDIHISMSKMGQAMIGAGEAYGDARALRAAEAAINNPLLDSVSMKKVNEVLLNIAGGTDMTLFEINEAVNRIKLEVGTGAHILFGSTLDKDLTGKMRISIIAGPISL